MEEKFIVESLEGSLAETIFVESLAHRASCCLRLCKGALLRGLVEKALEL